MGSDKQHLQQRRYRGWAALVKPRGSIKDHGSITAFANRALYWTPRVLRIAFIAFVSVFALDAFGTDRPWRPMLAAAAMHLFPGLVLGVILALAWRQEWIGAAGRAALGLLPTVRYGHDAPRFILPIPGPLFPIGALFLINWLKHDQLRARR